MNTKNMNIYFEKRWGIIVLDECHKIRNPKTRIYEQVTSLQANCRIGLTGKFTLAEYFIFLVSLILR